MGSRLLRVQKSDGKLLLTQRYPQGQFVSPNDRIGFRLQLILFRRDPKVELVMQTKPYLATTCSLGVNSQERRRRVTRSIASTSGLYDVVHKCCP